MTDTQLLDLFKEALTEVAPDKAAQFTSLTLATSIEDLQVDSVTFMELVGAVEERVGRNFADDELQRITTFADLASLIRA